MATLMIRNSERQSFLTCRQQWEWAWVERLRAPQQDTKLVFGDFVHRSLAAYYKPGRKRGPSPASTFEKICLAELEDKSAVIWADEDYDNLVDLGVGMLERYVENWKDRDNEYSVVSSEQTFQLPIGKINGVRIVVVGTIDGVWRHLPSGKFRFVEHKTATSISRDALPMDEQVGTYWTYGPRWLRLQGILKNGQKLDGILYNWLRKAVPNPAQATDALGRNINKDGTVSKRQPPPYFDRQLTFRGETEAERVKKRLRQIVTDIIDCREDPSKVYKNPGMQFMPNCKFCAYRDMCELEETGNDWQAYRDAAYGTWNPYEEHELAERR